MISSLSLHMLIHKHVYTYIHAHIHALHTQANTPHVSNSSPQLVLPTFYARVQPHTLTQQAHAHTHACPTQPQSHLGDRVHVHLRLQKLGCDAIVPHGRGHMQGRAGCYAAAAHNSTLSAPSHVCVCVLVLVCGQHLLVHVCVCVCDCLYGIVCVRNLCGHVCACVQCVCVCVCVCVCTVCMCVCVCVY
jgi:hypothetical protein